MEVLLRWLLLSLLVFGQHQANAFSVRSAEPHADEEVPVLGNQTDPTTSYKTGNESLWDTETLGSGDSAYIFNESQVIVHDVNPEQQLQTHHKQKKPVCLGKTALCKQKKLPETKPPSCLPHHPTCLPTQTPVTDPPLYLLHQLASILKRTPLTEDHHCPHATPHCNPDEPREMQHPTCTPAPPLSNKRQNRPEKPPCPHDQPLCQQSRLHSYPVKRVQYAYHKKRPHHYIYPSKRRQQLLNSRRPNLKWSQYKGYPLLYSKYQGYPSKWLQHLGYQPQQSQHLGYQPQQSQHQSYQVKWP